MAVEPERGRPVSLRVLGTRPHVSPDGRRIAYTTPDEGIAVLELATGRETVLATRRSVSSRWAPDGRRLLSWSDRSGTHELWTINVDGSGAEQLSDGGGGYHEADWSPDGRRIGGRRVIGDGGDRWTINADGTGAALLFAGERMDSDPRWSPDGTRITFFRMITDPDDDLLAVKVDGSDLQVLVRGPTNDYHPTYGPAN
jgi:TolB protein